MRWWGVVIVAFVSGFIGFMAAALLCAASKALPDDDAPRRPDA